MITIHSIKEYLDWILGEAKVSTIKDENNSEVTFNHPLYSIYYRGQADQKWEITPAIFREPYKDNATVESDMLRQSENILWHSMSSYSTYLEKLVFLQHYGMPTRLLDVTFNPLVALYFACSSLPKCDGAISYGFHIDNQNELVAELSANYLFHNETIYEEVIRKLAEDNQLSKSNFASPIFVFPPMNNPRIISQKGAFIMSPLLKSGERVFVKNTDSLNDSPFFQPQRVIIPCGCKKPILQDLYKLGTSRGSIFQGVVDKISDIIAECQWKREEIDNIDFGG